MWWQTINYRIVKVSKQRDIYNYPLEFPTAVYCPSDTFKHLMDISPSKNNYFGMT